MSRGVVVAVVGAFALTVLAPASDARPTPLTAKQKAAKAKAAKATTATAKGTTATAKGTKATAKGTTATAKGTTATAKGTTATAKGTTATAKGTTATAKGTTATTATAKGTTATAKAKTATAKGTKARASSKSKALAASTKRGKRGTRDRRKTRIAAAVPRVKTTAKPLVKVASISADGRVKYGADRMPPGFAWPPTEAMAEVGAACEKELDALGIVWKHTGAEGMVPDPIVVPSMVIGGVTYTSRFRRPAPTMDCQFVRALATVGPDLVALGVREVQYGSVYRNTLARSHGQTKDFLSKHALGIAMDITSFVDESGRVARVETDYLKGDPLLHGIEDLINARTQFRPLLTPGNDPISHDDHFHIEASVDFTRFR